MTLDFNSKGSYSLESQAENCYLGAFTWIPTALYLVYCVLFFIIGVYMRKVRENLRIKKELIGTSIAGILYLISSPIIVTIIKDFPLYNSINRKLL